MFSSYDNEKKFTNYSDVCVYISKTIITSSSFAKKLKSDFDRHNDDFCWSKKEVLNFHYVPFCVSVQTWSGGVDHDEMVLCF